MKYPQMRRELMEYLEGMSSCAYQNACWVNGLCPPGVEHDEFDYAIHFFFDDTTLASDPEQLIGFCLRNSEEAVAVKEVCDAIDFVLRKYGAGLTDAEYIEFEEWDQVINMAAEAVKIFGQ